MREGLEGCSYSRQGNSFYSSSVTVCRSASSSRTPPTKTGLRVSHRPVREGPSGGPPPLHTICLHFSPHSWLQLLRAIFVAVCCPSFFPMGSVSMGAGWRQSNSARMGNRPHAFFYGFIGYAAAPWPPPSWPRRQRPLAACSPRRFCQSPRRECPRFPFR